MFRGKMALPPTARLEEDLRFLSEDLGADAIQFYDHNFFDREVDMVPLLEVLAKFQLPCGVSRARTRSSTCRNPPGAW